MVWAENPPPPRPQARIPEPSGSPGGGALWEALEPLGENREEIGHEGEVGFEFIASFHFRVLSFSSPILCPLFPPISASCAPASSSPTKDSVPLELYRKRNAFLGCSWSHGHSDREVTEAIAPTPLDPCVWDSWSLTATFSCSRCCFFFHLPCMKLSSPQLAPSSGFMTPSPALRSFS